jgi:tRNA dimethylallyltransferase
MRSRVILIAGPTASGKSALALRLAERFGGAVINADSMQVYRDLRILTARPSPQEEAAVPHLLFGHVDGAVNYSVGRWLDDLRAALDDVRARGLVPIITGGTGLYFRTALLGISDMPAVPEDVRARLRAEAEGQTPQELYMKLAARDPATAARLRPTDPQRILRALEIFEATGRPLSSFQTVRERAALEPYDCTGFFLAPSREEVYARIDARFDKMMDSGALEEIRALGERSLDPALPVMRAHGAPALLAYLDGRLTREEAVSRGKLDTRHYVKRQFTFARHQLPGFAWLESGEPEREALERLNALRA